MDRLFLDANVLFSAAYKANARVVRLWRLDDVVLYSSHYALEEARFNLAEESWQHRLMVLSGKLRFSEAGNRELPYGVSLPQKDAPILLAAIEAKADYLLTGDFLHFGPYFGRKVEGVTVILPGQYLRLRNRDG